MMKFYADLFALTADSISAKSIRRLRWITIGSLPFLPMVTFMVLYGLPGGYLAIPFIILFVACSILTVSVLLARIVNRVWARDKYLDEWETDIKRRSMTTAFMVVMYTASMAAAIWIVADDRIAPLVSEHPKIIPLLMLILLIGVGFYTQVFTQLSVIKPMEDDDLDEPEYVVTSSRSILGVMALVATIFISGAFVSGYYSGHRNHDIEHAAAQKVCGDAKVDTHKGSEDAFEVTCEGSGEIIRLDPETLEPI